MSAAVKIELPGIEKFKSGKVREVYDLGDQYLFVASDRISAFRKRGQVCTLNV